MEVCGPDVSAFGNIGGVAELIVWLLALLGVPAQPCEAISGLDANGVEVGVVVYGCNPGGVEPPYESVDALD